MTRAYPLWVPPLLFISALCLPVDLRGCCVEMARAHAQSSPSPPHSKEEVDQRRDRERALRESVNEALAKRLRSLRWPATRATVTLRFLPPSELGAYALERFKEQMDHAQLEREGELLSIQGLIPNTAAYLEAYQQLFARAVDGLYDPQARQLILNRSIGSVESENAVFAHELFHAAQDLTWGIAPPPPSRQSYDAKIARLAFFEADATLQSWVNPAGTAALPPPETIEAIAARIATVSAEDQGVIPAYVHQLFLRLYQEGLYFFARRARQGESWPEIRRSYSKPPESSAALMGADLPAEESAASLSCPSPPPPLQLRWSSPLGRLHWFILLSRQIGEWEARAITRAWRMEVSCLMRGVRGSYACTISRWHDMRSALQFADAVRLYAQSARLPLALSTLDSELRFCFGSKRSGELAAALAVMTAGSL